MKKHDLSIFSILLSVSIRFYSLHEYFSIKHRLMSFLPFSLGNFQLKIDFIVPCSTVQTLPPSALLSAPASYPLNGS
jgi:hypothetical protein